ncbi:hypothetical protein EDB19DRAFT_1697976, partial [Suillus lakei]
MEDWRQTTLVHRLSIGDGSACVQFNISLGRTGVTLSYIVTVQQSFGWMVRQIAECRWT